METVVSAENSINNPGSFHSFSERNGLDPASAESLVKYSEVLSEFRKLCLSQEVTAVQVTEGSN